VEAFEFDATPSISPAAAIRDLLMLDLTWHGNQRVPDLKWDDARQYARARSMTEEVLASVAADWPPI